MRSDFLPINNGSNLNFAIYAVSEVTFYHTAVVGPPLLSAKIPREIG